VWLPFLRHHGRVATYDFATFDVRLGLGTHFCGWDDGWSLEGKLTIDHGKPPMTKCPPLDYGARDRRGDSYRDWLPSEPRWWKRALWPAWRVSAATSRGWKSAPSSSQGSVAHDLLRAVLVHPPTRARDRAPKDIEAEARTIGVQLQRVEAGAPEVF